MVLLCFYSLRDVCDPDVRIGDFQISVWKFLDDVLNPFHRVVDACLAEFFRPAIHVTPVFVGVCVEDDNAGVVSTKVRCFCHWNSSFFEKQVDEVSKLVIVGYVVTQRKSRAVVLCL